MEDADLDQMDDLQQFALATLMTPKEKRHPIWVIAGGAYISGVLMTQNEKDQADLAYLKTFRKDAGFALSAAEESELQHDVAQEKYFDARYILISQATIHIGGMVMQSDVTIYYRHINAWGRGNPPMKKST